MKRGAYKRKEPTTDPPSELMIGASSREISSLPPGWEMPSFAEEATEAEVPKPAAATIKKFKTINKKKEHPDYQVRVIRGRVKCFSGPGTNHQVRFLAKRNEVFTIIKESPGMGAMNWGQLSSKRGWVPLDFCERLLQ